eukprot:6164712-Pyramimonas_sp.AAC.1
MFKETLDDAACALLQCGQRRGARTKRMHNQCPQTYFVELLACTAESQTYPEMSCHEGLRANLEREAQRSGI